MKKRLKMPMVLKILCIGRKIKMNIFTQGDNNFTEGIETLIVSLVVNNPFEQHHFFIMETNISEKNKERIILLQKKYNVLITFIKPKGTEFKDPIFTSMPRYNYEGMLRLLMHNYLPNELDRILYLDADIVVMGSLKDYYYQDFEDKHIVVHSTKRDGSGNHTYDIECGLYDMTKIKLPKDELIFNNGVFLVNLPLWRKDIDEELYLDCLKQNKDDIRFIDQDLMNLVFLGKTKKIIDRNYNCTYRHTIKLPKDYFEYIKNNTKILHFVERIKPWNYKHYLSSRLFYFYMKYYRIEHPISFFYRYLVFYIAKPIHLLTRAYRKLIRTIKGSI